MNKKLKVSSCQLHSVLGDFNGNSQKIVEAIILAEAASVDLLVLPELAICGYFPMDLSNYSLFITEEERALASIVSKVPSTIAVVLGSAALAPYGAGLGRFYNQAVVISGGKIIFRQNKTILANSDVFYEPRYFQGSTELDIFRWKDTAIGLLICEDLWHEELLGDKSPLSTLVKKGAELIISINASPYYKGKRDARLNLAKAVVARGVAFVYANSCGAQDDLVFEGSSLLMRADASFIEGELIENQSISYYPFGTNALALADDDELRLLLDVIVMAIKGFALSNGFKKLHLGLSGGIDSALVAVLATMALGSNNVTALLLPSKFSSTGSLSDARALVNNLDMKAITIPINEGHREVRSSLAPFFSIEGVTDENIQARIRGLYLMAFSNQSQSLLLTTGNKSELATGYGTLYGDMCGGLNPIGDLYKTEVYRLARYINNSHGADLIPQVIIDKEPSAELREGQKDQDNLPPYTMLDPLLYDFIEEECCRAELIKKYPINMVDKILPMVIRNEFKRFQSPPIVKLSKKSFGRGRLIPLSRSNLEL